MKLLAPVFLLAFVVSWVLTDSLVDNNVYAKTDATLDVELTFDNCTTETYSGSSSSVAGLLQEVADDMNNDNSTYNATVGTAFFAEPGCETLKDACVPLDFDNPGSCLIDGITCTLEENSADMCLLICTESGTSGRVVVCNPGP